MTTLWFFGVYNNDLFRINEFQGQKMVESQRGQDTIAWPVFAAICIFVLICLPSIFLRDVWTDEVFTQLVMAGEMYLDFPPGLTTPAFFHTLIEERVTLGETVRTLAEYDNHPPLYFIAVKLWAAAFGQSLLSLRLFSVLLGATTIFCFYRFLRLYSERLALPALPLFACSTAVLHFSTEVRHYIASLLLLVITLWCMASLDKARDRGEDIASVRMLLLAVITACVVLTNYLGIYSLLACYIWFIVIRGHWRVGLCSGVLSVLLASGWVALVIENHLIGPFRHEGWLGWPEQLVIFLKGTLGAVYVASHEDYPTFMHWVGRLLLSGLAALGLLSSALNSNRREYWHLALLFALLAAMPGVGVMTTNFITDKHHEALRYYMLAAPGWAGLLILGIAALYRFRGALGQAAWAGSLLALLSVANWGYAVSHYQGKTVYGTFSSMYSSHDNADSVIVAGMGYRPGNTSALLYALPPHANIFILHSEVKAQEIIDLIDPYENVWLIRVGETTVNIEDELARALQDSGRTSEKFLQIEHYTRRD